MQSEIDELRRRLRQTPNALHRQALLVNEATRWVDIHEIGGNNRGQVVEIFQSACAIPKGSPWCMAFVQYCITRIDEIGVILGSDLPPSAMATGANCGAVWNMTPDQLKTGAPGTGTVVVWKNMATGMGHTGIVTASYGDTFCTIEGNTSPGEGINRDGDGVYRKIHSLGNAGSSLTLIGFIKPWG